MRRRGFMRSSKIKGRQSKWDEKRKGRKGKDEKKRSGN
jgi:hypothetical protein